MCQWCFLPVFYVATVYQSRGAALPVRSIPSAGYWLELPPSNTVAMPCITPIRWYASFHWLKGTHSGVLLQAEPASVACEGWESYASGVPRGGVEHPRGGESELLRSVTGWRKEKPARPLPARLTCCPRWLPSRGLFLRILSARSWFAHAGRSSLAANGRFAAQRLDPEGNGPQLLERYLLQRAGGRCAVNCVDRDGLGA